MNVDKLREATRGADPTDLLSILPNSPVKGTNENTEKGRRGWADGDLAPCHPNT